MLAFIVPPITVVFLVGAFSKRGNAGSAIKTMVIGHIFSISVFALQKIEVLPPIHFTIVAGLLFAVSLGVFMLTSKGEATKTDEELSDLLVGNNPPAQPGLKNYKIQAGALLALTFVIVALFSTWTQIAWMVSGIALAGIIYYSTRSVRSSAMNEGYVLDD